jgi:2-C-methyl-D-erythritol 4-phosphate cytidylyltransferase/2-C-methyl-D-erythritol 2,4-cyclodiphosphate synthase
VASPTPLAGILVAAGRSRRMGEDKLWIDLWGRPPWRWSLDLLLAVPGMDRCAVVVPAGAEERFTASVPDRARSRCLVRPGGELRAASVLAGLAALREAGVDASTLVLVHDAARPAASAELVARVLTAMAVGNDAVVPGLPVADSLRRVEGGALLDVVERSGVVSVQTPQAARLGTLLEALESARARGEPPSDEAAALLAHGVAVAVVEGEAGNLKLTTPGDVEIVHAALARRAAPLPREGTAPAGTRVGLGFDAHRFEEGRPLRLGGLDYPDEPAGLAGHSDGDAALHAIADALLGAAGLGDLGTLFPSNDARWLGANSGDLLRSAVVRLREAGWAPVAVDLTIVAARPQIAPRRAETERRIAELIGCPADAVSVRGTTSDGLGFGGAEGLAAYVVAQVAQGERAA